MSTETSSIPQHVAIIMDGNGRWAQARGLPRLAGHKQGAETVEKVVRAAADAGIKTLTLFAFSTENWNRPAEEVTGLMSLLMTYLRSKTAEMHKNNVRLKIIGDRVRLGEEINALVTSAEDLTAKNTGITVQMALSYSGRWDMTQAVQELAQQVKDGVLQPTQITEEMISDRLSTAGLPDPDLVIRTSGEQRVSNFLLWQSAYAEYFFTDIHWPDFSKETLNEAIQAYQQRDRRFGKIRVSAS